MPAFGKRSTANLEEAHPDLQTIFNEVIKYFDCSVIDGHRGEKEQNKAFNSIPKKSHLKYPASKHNKIPSMAVDAVPYPISWKDIDRMRYFAGYVMGIANLLKNRGIIDHNVRWGGDWDKDTEVKDNKFQDFPHFELV